MARVESVALLLTNSRGELFLIRELINKPEIGKRWGDLSVPWETKLPGEGDLEALARLLTEEVDDCARVALRRLDLLGSLQVREAAAAVYRGTLDERLLGLDEIEAFPLCGSRAGVEYEPLGFQGASRLFREAAREGIWQMRRLFELDQRYCL
jgi:hypothetical protein